jgi:hypothetical protein
MRLEGLGKFEKNQWLQRHSNPWPSGLQHSLSTKSKALLTALAILNLALKMSFLVCEVSANEIARAFVAWMLGLCPSLSVGPTERNKKRLELARVCEHSRHCRHWGRSKDSYCNLHATQDKFTSINVRFEVFTAVTMKNAVSWDIKTLHVPHRRHITSQL